MIIPNKNIIQNHQKIEKKIQFHPQKKYIGKKIQGNTIIKKMNKMIIIIIKTKKKILKNMKIKITIQKRKILILLNIMTRKVQ